MTVADVLLVPVAMVAAIVVWRLHAGPTGADRVIALDLGFVVFVAATALLSVRLQSPAVLILVLAATLLGFIATVAAAELLERQTR